LLGYEPIVDFREGLRRTVEWYRPAAERIESGHEDQLSIPADM